MPPSIGCEGSLNGVMSVKNDVAHLLWPSQSSDLNLREHKWEILDKRLRQRSLPPPLRHKIRDYLSEEWCSVPPEELRRLGESMPSSIEHVLAARGGPRPY